jgi:hypothetical protein
MGCDVEERNAQFGVNTDGARSSQVNATPPSWLIGR